ncbi:MAG: zinc-ribbon domain-containing protein [Methanoregula sp.]|uniref:zinc ribbon domain-containing protein n=1 Tax=Methanoregula sp. TaxID=2052170 RepID=UPI003BB10B72
MDDPELRGDEQILMRTQGIHVKSISFEAILTNKRIILVDRIKNLLPPKEIPLVTIQSIESGENAIRDLVIRLGVITKSGGTRQMVLTFAREGGGNRVKERDEWVNQIRVHTTPSFEQVMKKVIPGIDLANQEKPTSQVFNPPVPSVQSPEFTRTLKKIVETVPGSTQQPEKVKETILGTYCTRCGTRVPDTSDFCTKCGARILALPVGTQEPAAAPVSSMPEPAILDESPIENATRSLEQLVTKAQVAQPQDKPSGAIPRPAVYTPETGVPPSSEPELMFPPNVASESSKAPLAEKRFMPKLFSPKDLSPTPLVPSSMPNAVSPPPKKPSNRKKIVLAGIIIVIIIIAAIAFVVLPKVTSLGAHSSSGSTVTVPTTIIPVTTSATVSSSDTPVVIATHAPVTVPTTGVYVTVDYIGGFNGSYSFGGVTTNITPNSGAQSYLIDNATGTVTAVFQKTDDTTTHPLTVGIYKNGNQLASNTTSAAFGKITVSAGV